MSEIPMTLLPGGVDMPMVGLGTWRLSGRDGYAAIRCALEAGYRHIDTAAAYGNEAIVGRAVRDSGLDRTGVFITTKLPAANVGREREILGESLRALGMDYTDLWLVHGPPGGQAAPAVWREFLSLRSAGMCRAVGVSNYSLAQIDELTAATGQAPAVNQIPWSLSLHDPGLLSAVRERGIALEGYSPLLSTRLADPVLRSIASRHEVTPSQVVLRWHLEHGITVIPKSARPARIRSNVDLFCFSLTVTDMECLDSGFCR